MKDDRVRDERVLVYSTDGGMPLPAPSARRKPMPAGNPLPADGVVRIAREKRRNSAVTIVYGLAAGEVEPIGKELKRLCGSGGTAKNGVVEIQGDHRDRILAYFAGRGRRAKMAGG
jgi:translation initiation factor 1